MKHIFIFGASITHGVGAEQGWADLLKSRFHHAMFGPNGQGEVCTVYELGIPGTGMPQLLDRFEQEIRSRQSTLDPAQTYIVFSAGTNDSKAIDAIDNHLLSAQDFAANVQAFLHLAKTLSHHLIGVGITPVDEAKTMPHEQPLSGKRSYFTNNRLQQFEETLAQTCAVEDVDFIPLFSSVPDDWSTRYVAADGIHPNSAGHAWICDQVEPTVRSAVGV